MDGWREGETTNIGLSMKTRHETRTHAHDMQMHEDTNEDTSGRPHMHTLYKRSPAHAMHT